MCPPPSGGCGNGHPFPDATKTCVHSTDCVIAYHQLDCCGSELAMGIAATSHDAFTAAEMAWESTCPACGCAAALPTAEDGQMCAMAQITVDCVNGSCTTHCH
jgi:hypothetical protein